jgi:hypothetical protein
MIPLASDLLPFPDQMRREDHLKSASLPDRLSSSGRAVIVGTLSRKCPVILAVLRINHSGVAKQPQQSEATDALGNNRDAVLCDMPEMP